MAEKDFSKMDADEIKDLMSFTSSADGLGNLSMTLIVEKIKDHLTQLDTVQLNIAVTGESGSGKSTFINAFRGLRHEEADSAPTGSVETTLEPKAYSHPKYPNVKLWDLPGIGTPTFKADQYLIDVKFERYDFFIIVTQDRFRECHVQLTSEIQKIKKNFYFLRSKIDTNIRDERDSKPKSFNEERILETIRQNCIEGLEKNNVAAPVFLISSLKLGLYDFDLLLDTIEKELPDHKRYVLLLALPNITMDILQRKKTALKKNIWKMALLSGAVAAVPVPGLPFAVDVAILLKQIKKYHKAFGLDNKSLQELAEKLGVSVGELNDERKHTGHMTLTIKSVIAQLITTTTLAAVVGQKLLLYLIPIVGSTIAAGVCFTTTYYLLNKYLEELATDAHNVLMKAAMPVKMLSVSEKNKH